jgi:hypothetical protein
MLNPSKNDVTGDPIVTGSPSKAYLANYDAIFRKPKPVVEMEFDEVRDDGIYTCWSDGSTTLKHSFNNED